jgi:hypothetical protein
VYQRDYWNLLEAVRNNTPPVPDHDEDEPDEDDDHNDFGAVLASLALITQLL